MTKITLHLNNPYVCAQALYNFYLVVYTEFEACTGYYSPFDDPSNYLLKWTVRGDMIDFVVYAFSIGWVGIGFSDDPLMVSIYI